MEAIVQLQAPLASTPSIKTSCADEIEGWVGPRRDNFLVHAVML